MVRYRVTKIEKMAGDDVAFTVDVRHYAASAVSTPEGLPPDSNLMLQAFDSFGRVVYTRKVKQLVPTSAQLKVPFTAQLGQPGAQRSAGRMVASLVAEVTTTKAGAGKKK